MWDFSWETLTWTLINYDPSNSPSTTGIYGHTAVKVGNQMLVLGGNVQADVLVLYSFDMGKYAFSLSLQSRSLYIYLFIYFLMFRYI